jgi:hypothetical protein
MVGDALAGDVAVRLLADQIAFGLELPATTVRTRLSSSITSSEGRSRAAAFGATVLPPGMGLAAVTM